MTDQLSLYNGALRLLGERRLANLTEDVEARYRLDDAYTDAIETCLEEGLWNFALRTGYLTYSPSITPPFGYRYAFDKPVDFVRLDMISSDERFLSPLTRYEDESSYWFADVEAIYIRFVSKDAQYGLDMSLWPPSFVKVVEAYLANEICEGLTQSSTKGEKIMKALAKALRDAKSKDAMNEPTRFLPTGSWVSARGRGLRNRTGQPN